MKRPRPHWNSRNLRGDATHRTLLSTVSLLVPPLGRGACRLPPAVPTPGFLAREGPRQHTCPCRQTPPVGSSSAADPTPRGILPPRDPTGRTLGVWPVPFEVGMVPGDTPASEGNPRGLAGDSEERAGLEPAVGPPAGQGGRQSTSQLDGDCRLPQGWEARPRGHGPGGWESRIQCSPEESPDSS